ncbi:hypothetical protein [Paenibacillus sp. LHD-38]|nr:hypothetical protein [Paenibacillus sp. LHD-38]MDQ8737186.1 hypothetical protein [Paenibacillus sp. LHD-38]
MRLLFIIAGMLTVTNYNKVEDDCVSKLNEAFVGNEQYWKSTKPSV